MRSAHFGGIGKEASYGNLGAERRACFFRFLTGARDTAALLCGAVPRTYSRARLRPPTSKFSGIYSSETLSFFSAEFSPTTRDKYYTYYDVVFVEDENAGVVCTVYNCMLSLKQ